MIVLLTSQRRQTHIVGLMLLLFILCTATRSYADRPNLVFIIADDCTFRDIGCYGGQAHTPNIDGLAEQGMQFNNCFQTAPMCSPTRHNIYTGLYPVKSGAYPNHTFAKNGTKSVVHYLKPLGYRVGLSGKRHIAPDSVFPFDYLGQGKKNPDMAAISQWIKESKASQSPFCLFACSNEPHSPWDKGDASRYPPSEVKLPPYVVDTPELREAWSHYLAEITYFDGQVGQILELLNQHQLTENTLVMVVSEQGNSFPFAKWTCYENGLQSALIVRWPGKVEAKRQTDALVEYVDVLPTFVEAAGGTPAKTLDGKSFLPVLLGKTEEHKTHTYGLMTTRGIISGSEAYPIRSIRDHRHRLILNLNHEAEFENALTHGKLYQTIRRKAEQHPPSAELVHRYAHRPAIELYDIVEDPMNIRNLAEDPSKTAVIQELRHQLEAWMQSQGDEGMATEMRAKERQSPARNQAKKKSSKKNKRQKAKAST